MYLSAEKVLEQFQHCSNEKLMQSSIWQAIKDIMLPTKSDPLNESSPGEAKFNQIFDSTAMVSLEDLASALHGMLSNPTSFFFGLTTGEPDFDNDDEVRLWIQDVVRKMHMVLNNSNFQTEVHEYYLDLVGFGNGPLLMEEDVNDIVRFSERPLKEITIKENSKGRIDTFYRHFKLSPRGFYDEFGEENVPDFIKEQYKDGKTVEHEVIHAVYPKELAGYDSKSKFPFISQYILKEKKKDILVKGYREFPLVFGRWTKTAGESYGRGCGEKALPEAKTLNEMVKTTVRGAQKVVDPPLQMPDDGFILPLITRPAGVNFYRAGSQDRVEPIFNDSRVDFGFQVIEQKTMKIREAFYVDRLKLRDGPQMTATEVNERIEQALRFMSPMLGRQQAEFLSPMVMRLYGICERRGLFKPAPAKLKNKSLKIYYSSVMAAAQRMSEMTQIQRTFQAMAPLVAVNPMVMDLINADKTAKHIAKLQNFPQECLNNEREIAGVRQARQEAQANAQAQAEAQTGADTINKVSSAVKNLRPA